MIGGVRRLTAIGAIASIALGLNGCGGDDVGSAPGTEDPTAATTGSGRDSNPSEDVAASPVVDDRFNVGKDGVLAMRCWGEGSPTVVLETGHPTPGGITDFDGSEFVRELASQTAVCAYDRLGTGMSDDAPSRPRDADDVVEDLNALLEASGVDEPYVLVGASFGGMVVTYYAAKYPGEVAGVVLLDVPAPSNELTVEEIPEIAWDHPENPEHLDIVPEFEGRFAREPVSFEAALVVVTASGGQSSVEDQQDWLEGSPDARQIELDGGHDVWLDNPVDAAAAVLDLLDAAE
jgi:pimeloyl-ACP methyl ester carboxylesterase